MLTGPMQHFFSSILDAWRYRIFAKLAEREGFPGVQFADFKGSLQQLISSHLRERDKMSLRVILCGGVWNGFLLGRAKKEDDLCGKKDGDGHLFWECSFPPLLHVRELPEFSYLSCDGERDSWAASFGQLACLELERCLGGYPLDSSGYWVGLLLIIGMLTMLLWRCRIILIFVQMVAGRISLLLVGLRWLALVAEEHGDARLERCCAFMPVPGVLQTVQRAEFWGAILALQAYWPFHLGIDNLNVARTTGRLLDRDCLTKPLPLVKGGTLVALAQYMIGTRGRQTVGVTKVTGHATPLMLMLSRAVFGWRISNAEADAAADLGRRHRPELLMDARRSLLEARAHWYLIMHQLHRFMIAVSWVAVNHGGEGVSAPDPLIWDHGGRRKMRRTDIRINIDLASLPGPRGFLNGPWMQVHGGRISGADVAAWPRGVGISCVFTALLGTLHWPCDAADLGHFGISFWGIFSFSSNGLVIGCSVTKVTRLHGRANRPIFDSLCVSEGIEIRHGCQFVSSMVRALSKLPGGMGGLVLVLTCQGYVIWSGTNVLMVVLQDC